MGRGVCIAATLLAAGCYSPVITEGLPCSESNDCPDGQYCDAVTETCVVNAPHAAQFGELATGSTHACGITGQPDGQGELWCWGSNGNGELGISSGEDALVPVRVGGDADWTEVSAGHEWTLAVKADGSLWSWGVDGAPITRVGSRNDWAQVAAGFGGYCAIDTGGVAECDWGGGLGPAAPGMTWKRISGSNGLMCGITLDDLLFCWGSNSNGAAGDGTTNTVIAPFEVDDTVGWLAVDTSHDHTCGVQTDGLLRCWGNCVYGQLGDGDSGTGCRNPAPVTMAGGGYRDVAVGPYHSCALADDNHLHCFGLGADGQTGSGRDVDLEPRERAGIGFSAFDLGAWFTCGLESGTNDTLCWGYNGNGQLGNGLGGPALEPAPVEPTMAWSQVEAGSRSTCAIRDDGTLWCWGRNGRGQLGTGDTRQSNYPLEVTPDDGWTDVTAVSSGREHTCALRDPGTLWCWGANDHGQLGMSSGPESLVPVQFGTDDDWREVAAASVSTCALKGTGELWCWGNDAPAPQRRGSDTGWTSLTVLNQGLLEASELCAVLAGEVFCWLDYEVPVDSISGVAGWTSVATGYQHACGLRSGGQVWCFGSNTFGQLGDGTDTDQPIAVQEDSGSVWRSVDVGLAFTCGITMDDDLYCWGRNNDGNLGDGSGDDQWSPTRVGSAGWDSLSVGTNHACGIQPGGGLWCWGDDANGMLGIGRGGSARVVRVAPPPQ